MSDIQGDRPEDQTPAVPTQPAAEAAAQTPAEPEVAAASAAPVPPAAPAAPPVPPTPAADAATAAPSAQPASQSTPAATTPPAPPAGYPAGAQAYARPQGYAGQPAPYPHSYAGQQQPAAPAPGASFGVNPADTQPTLPIGGAAGAMPTSTATDTTAKEKKPSAAGKVVGLIVAAAIVGGAAGLGGAYAGVSLFAPVSASPVAGPATVTVNDTDEVNQTTRDRREGAAERRDHRGDELVGSGNRFGRRPHRGRLCRDQHARRDPRRRHG